MFKLTKSLLPTYVLEKDEDASLITDENCYIIAENGMFAKTKQEFYASIHKITEPIKGLGTVVENTHWTMPGVPIGLILMVVRFFKKVFDKHKSEACVLLYYNGATKAWIFDVPKQTVSGGSVKYDRIPKVFEGYMMFGTIHSHASMGAFHSGVDTGDEFDFDGIHITIGDFDRGMEDLSFCARVMAGRSFYKINLLEAVNGDTYELIDVPEAWMDNITTSTTTPYNYGNSGWGSHYPASKWDDRDYEDRYGAPVPANIPVVATEKKKCGVRRKSKFFRSLFPKPDETIKKMEELAHKIEHSEEPVNADDRFIL